MIDQQFNTLNDKLQLLLKHLHHLQHENAQLRAALQAALGREAAMQAEVTALKQQSAILKLASGEMPDKDKKDFERTINQYIRQIDQCIAFLSQ